MHIFIKILYFILILAVMGYLNHLLLYGLFLMVGIAALALQPQLFLRVIQRMRWLFLSILVIYAFATPGEFMPGFPLSIAPTIEGLYLGAAQVVRLLMALAALTLLYASSSKEQLISGLYILFKPLKYLGLNVERFAVRLILTLEYVEALAIQQNKQKVSLAYFDAIATSNAVVQGDKVIALAVAPFKTGDKLMMVIFIALALMLVFFNFLI